MADDLLIRIAPPGGAAPSWRVADAAPAHGPLAEAAPMAAGRRVVLLVPGTEVLLTTVQVPAKNRAKARTAIPWVLEDRLVQDVEDLQFALGDAAGEGVWRVAVIARERLEARLAACREAGLEPDAVVAEPLALPPPGAGRWTVLEEPGRVTVRTGAEAGFACEPEMLGMVAATLEAPDGLERHRATGVEVATDWSPGLDDAVADSGTAVDHRDILTGFDAGAAGRAINLLQGDYSRQERAGRALRQWRVPGAVAAALVAVLLLEALIGHIALGRREEALRAQLEQVFRETFPDAERVVNPRSQMEARAARLRGGGGSGFADLLARAGAVVTARDDARLTAVTWREGTLELELAVGGLQALDAVQQGMQEAGLTAEITGADRSGERVAGQIRIGAAEG